MSGPNNEDSDGLFAGLPAEYQQNPKPLDSKTLGPGLHTHDPMEEIEALESP